MSVACQCAWNGVPYIGGFVYSDWCAVVRRYGVLYIGVFVYCH